MPLNGDKDHSKFNKTLNRIRQNKVTNVSNLHYLRYHQGSGGKDGSDPYWQEIYGLEPGMLKRLFALMADNTSVTELDLTLNLQLFDAEIAESFKEAFQINKTVRVLNLSKNRKLLFPFGGWALKKESLPALVPALAEILEVNKTLQTIYLQKCHLDAEAIKPLCAALRHSSLEILDVSKNKLGDEGARLLLSALIGNTQLHTLSIGGNGISKAFMKKEMPSLLKQIPMLKNIDLGFRVTLPWNKELHNNITKITQNRELPFFEACNFLLMYWWRERRSPHSDSPLSLLAAVAITRILMHLRDAYEETVPNKVLHRRVRHFAKAQDKTLCKNLYPKEDIKKPSIRTFESLQENQKSGVYHYALTANGQLMFGKKSKAPGGRHIDLVNGFLVRAAGNVEFKKGDLINYDNASIHYLPTPEQTKREMNYALQAFEKKQPKFIAKKWFVDETHENHGEWVPAGKKYK